MAKSNHDELVKQAQQAAQPLIDEELPAEQKQKLEAAGLSFEVDGSGSEAIVNIKKVFGKISYLLKAVREFTETQPDLSVATNLIDLARHNGNALSAVIYASKSTPVNRMSVHTNLFLEGSAPEDGYAASCAEALRAAADSTKTFLKQKDIETRLLAYREELASKSDMLDTIGDLFNKARQDDAREIGVEDIGREILPASMQMEDPSTTPEDKRLLENTNQALASVMAAASIENIHKAPASIKCAGGCN